MSSTNTWGREMWRVRDKARCVGRCLTGSRVTSTPSPKNWDYTLYTKGREDPRRTAWCSDRHGNQDWQRLAKQMAMQTGKSLCCARCSSGTRLTWAGGNRGRRDPPERQHTPWQRCWPLFRGLSHLRGGYFSQSECDRLTSGFRSTSQSIKRDRPPGQEPKFIPFLRNPTLGNPAS